VVPVCFMKSMGTQNCHDNRSEDRPKGSRVKIVVDVRYVAEISLFSLCVTYRRLYKTLLSSELNVDR